MSRRWIIAALAAAAAIAILGRSHAQEIGEAAGGGGLVPVLALVAAVAALAVALIAVSRASRANADFIRFTRSMEMALRELSTRSERDAASIGELNRKIGEEIRSLTESMPPPAAADVPEAPAAVAQEAPQIVRLQTERTPETDTAAAEGIRRALLGAVASGEAEVSLEPIISVAQSMASGFEVHLHLEPDEGGKPVDVRRLAQPVPGVDPLAFETMMVRAAIAAGRRQLGSSAERMPFHVPVSEALLGAASEVGSIADLAQIHKALTASVVFSVPAALMGQGGEVRDGIDRLTGAGFRLAVENWDGSGEDAAALARRGVAFAKISANRLLDRERSRRRMPSGAELAAALQDAGLSVVATGVGRDEDAVGLIDLGIDLMVGERFSGPRRIRSASARQTALTGT